MKLVKKKKDTSNVDKLKVSVWKILIVDDELDVHTVTRATLQHLNFADKSLQILQAMSGMEAQEILVAEPEIAVALIDIVMETDDAGLKLVDFIRNELHNSLMRLIIRTGQPGVAPETDVVERYDINDYKDKTELTSQKLYTTIRLALKSYQDLNTLQMAEQAVKQAKDKAEAANHAKSEFLANMSHEIRTPMNAVIGFSELLSTLITDKKQKSYLNAIQTAGKTLLTLINDILDLSKIEAGRLEIQYEVVNPYTLFNELKQIFAVKIAEKNLEFRIDLEDKLPPALMLDEIRLRQVLVNLIGNAIKFTDTGYIELKIRHSPQYNTLSPSQEENVQKRDLGVCLTIIVADTGIGIPIEQQALIFDSFQQQEGQNTRKYGGTGLGLAITKRLVKMMNGNISVTSTIAQGSSFEITLPNVTVSAIQSVKLPKRIFNFKEVSFEKAVVLVVDDIEANRNLIKEWLSQANLQVIEAENGQQALILTQEYHPDLILMDIRMPMMDGYEATQKLKQEPSTHEIPIIALTASFTLDEQTKMKACGFNGYLSKPVNTQELFQELSDYLPHTDKIESDTETVVIDDTAKTLVLEEIVELAVLRQTLEQEMLPIWQKITNMIEIESIEAFAKQLIQLGEKHHAQHFIYYSTHLLELTEELEIGAIEQKLTDFPEMVKQLY